MSAPDPAPAATAAPDDDWQALPVRARTVFMLGAAVSAVCLLLVALSLIVALVSSPAWTAALGIAAVAGIPGFLLWLAWKRHRHTRWRLDPDGFALRRGSLWRTETRVPASRVQHLDIRRGPIERNFGLSTLVIHTAGTRHNAVAAAGLDAADAERLRDSLARGIARDGDDDDA